MPATSNAVERGDRPCIFDLDGDSHRLQALLTAGQLAGIDFVRGDVASFDDLDRAVADRGITHLIHLAALQVPACAADPVLGAKVNVIGTLQLSKAVIPHLERDAGTAAIVHILSQSMWVPATEIMQAAYMASKGALLSATYGMAKELGPFAR